MKFLKGLAISLLSSLLFFSVALFGIIFMLDNTLLDPDFVTAEINRLDIASLARDLLGAKVSTGMPQLDRAIDKTVADLEPWLKEEAGRLIYSGYDYLLGRTEELSLIISTEPAKNTLKDNLIEAILASPPPELQSMPPAVIKQYADQAYQQVGSAIPPTIGFTKSSIPAEVMAPLERVRSYLSHYRTAYYGLIGLMVVSASAIFLISRDLKQTTRSIGITLVVYGGIGYVITFALDYFNLEEQMIAMTGGIPLSLQTWLGQFMDNLMAPLETFDLALLIIGVLLIVVSIVYRRHRAPAAE
ncbi:MAG: hypothetical protein HYY80_05340 [Chloroflexi bacterium]|nr:hypothetical protein [Chloroflexota bacterium]MBI3931704.1 hypothetical protein [Chloroflexota bacterium]